MQSFCFIYCIRHYVLICIWTLSYIYATRTPHTVRVILNYFYTYTYVFIYIYIYIECVESSVCVCIYSLQPLPLRRLPTANSRLPSRTNIINTAPGARKGASRITRRDIIQVYVVVCPRLRWTFAPDSVL